MKTKTLACFFSATGKKICVQDFETVLHRSFGRGAVKGRRKRKRKR